MHTVRSAFKITVQLPHSSHTCVARVGRPTCANTQPHVELNAPALQLVSRAQTLLLQFYSRHSPFLYCTAPYLLLLLVTLFTEVWLCTDHS
jgi:hypothetical protein